MKFDEMTDDELDLWYELHFKNFDPYDCWENGCDCVEERILDDYDEQLYCDHCSDDECPMFEIWKKKDGMK